MKVSILVVLTVSVALAIACNMKAARKAGSKLYRTPFAVMGKSLAKAPVRLVRNVLHTKTGKFVAAWIAAAAAGEGVEQLIERAFDKTYGTGYTGNEQSTLHELNSFRKDVQSQLGGTEEGKLLLDFIDNMHLKPPTKDDNMPNWLENTLIAGGSATIPVFFYGVAQLLRMFVNRLFHRYNENRADV